MAEDEGRDDAQQREDGDEEHSQGEERGDAQGSAKGGPGGSRRAGGDDEDDRDRHDGDDSDDTEAQRDDDRDEGGDDGERRDDEDDDGDGDGDDDGDDSDDNDDDGEDDAKREQRRKEVAATRKNAEATKARRESADEEARQRDESRQDKKRKRLKLLGIAAGIAALIVVIAILISSLGGEAEKKAGEDDSPVVGAQAIERRYAGIPQEGFTLGREDAPVRLVEFADLQCPFCKDAAGGSLPSLVDRYVKPGRLRIEFRNFAILGPDSEKAARAAQAAAEQGKAWQFIDLWYVNQGEENSGYVTDEFIRKIAGGVRGLDAEAVVQASNSNEAESLAEARTAAQRYGVESTPSYLIGTADGELQQLQVQDPTNPGLFAQAIDRQLGQAGE